MIRYTIEININPDIVTNTVEDSGRNRQFDHGAAVAHIH